VSTTQIWVDFSFYKIALTRPIKRIINFTLNHYQGILLMAVFLIERNFAEQVNMNPEVAATLNQIGDDTGVQWLISFLSADKKKTYCLYEASSPEAIREAAKIAGIPADVIIPVSEMQSNGMVGTVNPERFT
jgi:hypothetical protein